MKKFEAESVEWLNQKRAETDALVEAHKTKVTKVEEQQAKAKEQKAANGKKNKKGKKE